MTTKKTKPVLLPVALIALVACVIVVIFLAMPEETKIDEPFKPVETQLNESDRMVVAIVNGRNVYEDEIDRELATLPPEIGQTISRDEVLEFIIIKRVLLIASEEERVVVTREQIKDLYNSYARLFGRNDTEQLIAEQGLRPEEFAERVAEQAAINALIEKKQNEQNLVKKEDVIHEYELNYADRNVSLEEVEEEIVLSIVEKRKKAFMAEAYVSSLRESANVTLFPPYNS